MEQVKTYYPENLQEALAVREETHARPFMGGTDLMVRYRSWAGTLPRFPWPVLFLSHLRELKTVRETAEAVIFGAGTSLTETAEYSGCPELLRKAVLDMAAPALRNIGTMAGNIGNASPAGDAVCALIALDAAVTLNSSSGERIVPVEHFITGPGTTVMHDDELITEISVPKKEANRVFYRKVGTRKANALSKLSIAADAFLEGSRIARVRIAAGAVGPKVLRSRSIEKRIEEMPLPVTSEKLNQLTEEYAGLIKPIDDQRSTAAYRKQAALNLLRQFLLSI